LTGLKHAAASPPGSRASQARRIQPMPDASPQDIHSPAAVMAGTPRAVATGSGARLLATVLRRAPTAAQP
jgi:hypothetical protein